MSILLNYILILFFFFPSDPQVVLVICKLFLESLDISDLLFNLIFSGLLILIWFLLKIFFENKLEFYEI